MNNDQLTIDNDQLPEGYQQTEVGVIPEDWNIRELGNLGKFKNGINKGSEDFGHGSPFVNLMDVFGISSISEAEHLGLVNSNDAEKKVYDLREGDVLFIRSSVKPSGVGLTTVVTRDLPNTVYSGFLIRFRDSENLETDFKKYCFSEEKFRQRVVANSTVSANTNINQDNLKKLNLAYPESAAEQRSISQALSDVDALIAGLDKAIAKQRAIKTATMQQLLTGKKRLPEFGEGKGDQQTEVGVIPKDWNVVTIREITSLVTNGFVGKATNHYTDKDDGITYIQGYNVEANSFNFNGIKKVTPEFHRIHQKSCLRKDDLLTIQTGEVGLTTIVPDSLVGANCHALIISRFKKEKAYPWFYAHYFNSPIAILRTVF